MIRVPPPTLDDRNLERIVQQILQRRLGYLPDWSAAESGPAAALVQVAARYLKTLIDRLNQAAEKNKLAFLDRLDIQLIPAQAAEAPIVFQMSEEAAETAAPERTQVAAPPPPESSERIVFETRRRAGLTPARIKQVVSVWPGRDQYIDHSADFLADTIIRPFEPSQLKNTPHILYVAHGTLLALAGAVQIEVEFELNQVGSEQLDVTWEYWDGAVWREFFNQRRECEEPDQEPFDGTAGLTRSGKFTLTSECAESAKKIVNDVEAFWIRGRLDEPLPIDPRQILPAVTQLRLSSLIQRDLQMFLAKDVQFDDAPVDPGEIRFADTNGGTLENALASLFDEAGELLIDGPETVIRKTDSEYGHVVLNPALLDPTTIYTLEVAHATTFRILVNGQTLINHPILTLQIEGLHPDDAFADAQPVDFAEPFFPLGQQPQPGSTFYFSSEEAFTKPGATVSVHVKTATTFQDKFDLTVGDENAEKDPLNHQIAWEYWDGRKWCFLSVDTEHSEGVQDFTADGIVEFTVPTDMALVEVEGTEALWMRVRLISGSYGFVQHVKFNDNIFDSVVVQPPALADFRLSYVWQDGPKHAERVFTYNDFQFADETEVARWPGTSFQPFQQLNDITPALYLGFDKKLPVDRTNLYFDIFEEPVAQQSPALIWEFWNGFSWRPITVQDETRHLQVPGIVSLIGPRDAKSLARFRNELYWLRARLKEDGPPPQPLFTGIYPNAATIVQLETVRDEPLGISNGRPNQILVFPRFPVLEGERIEVRELSGKRAAVQWRILVRDLYVRQPQVIQDFEKFLASEKPQLEYTWGDLRLRRDRNKAVVEVWVRWHYQRNFFDSQANDRHYVLDRASGRLAFGDGQQGLVPPLDSAISAREFRTGGGSSGNVAREAISELLGGIAGVEKVFNPRGAEAGADGESLERFAVRGPKTLRHRGRAITPADIETMALEASPAVGGAWAAPTRDRQGRRRPGWVTLMIIPRNDDAQPQPSFGLREDVRRDIERRAPATLVAGHQLDVVGPEYHPVDVDATIAPVDPSKAGEVETAAEESLKLFLHPLRGGPQADGWQLGRDVYLSDVASVLERVEGVDYVRELTLLLEGVPQGESLPVPDGKIVAAGVIRIKLAFEE